VVHLEEELYAVNLTLASERAHSLFSDPSPDLSAMLRELSENGTFLTTEHEKSLKLALQSSKSTIKSLNSTISRLSHIEGSEGSESILEENEGSENSGGEVGSTDEAIKSAEHTLSKVLEKVCRNIYNCY